MKNMKKPVLLAVLVLVGLTCLPAESHAAKMCDYEYYYDAAHTQYAGYCYAACYAGGNFCIGELTAYYALVNCRPLCHPDDWLKISSSSCPLPERSSIATALSLPHTES